MKVLIIIPAYNEAENIKRVIDNLIMNYPQYEYIVVNDGSKDETAKICRESGYNLLDLPINIGLAGAVQTGIKYALRKKYDAVLQFDGDGQHNPEYIEQMISAMNKTKADIIIGSRFKEKKKGKNLRMLGSNMIQIAIKLTTKRNITDPTSGMRLLDKKILKSFANDMNNGPEPDTISYLIRCGVIVDEIQVNMNDRVAGESYLNLRRAIWYMIRMCTSIIFIQRFRIKGGQFCQ